MGDGWSFSYSDTMTPFNPTIDGSQPSGTLVWFTAHGDRLLFSPRRRRLQHAAHDLRDLTVPGTGYLWTDKTGATETFTPIGGTAYVTRISDRYGNGVNIDRNSSNGHITYGQRPLRADSANLSDPNNAIARYLTFTYTGSHITSITNFTGRTWLYDYDSSWRLVSVTAPVTGTAPSASFNTATTVTRHSTTCWRPSPIRTET